jgi:predicted NBD/HSP70 family sugar kinase
VSPPKLYGGVDLGGTKVQGAVVGARGEVAGEARGETPTSGGPQAVADAIASTMQEAAQAAGTEPSALEAIGLGSPGEVDADNGIVAQAKNVAGWDEPYALGPDLAEKLGRSVVVGNDVQVATQAEFQLGAGKPYKSVLGVFWGTGVGGGLILEGRPWVGRGAAGEIGHMVSRIGGRRCGCGRRGCVEAYAGRASMEAKARRLVDDGEHTDLFKLMEKHGRPRLTSGIWDRALRHGDKMAEQLIDQAVEALGAGIASAVNLLDVEAVIIGGGLGTKLGEPYVERIREAMMPHVFADQRPPAVLVAGLGDLGGAIGAAMAAKGAAKAKAPAAP